MLSIEEPIHDQNAENHIRVQIAEKDTHRWQKSVFPLMAGMIVLLTIVFVFISGIQTYGLQTQIAQVDQLEMGKSLSEIMDRHKKEGAGYNEDQVRWEALAILEAQALNRRYTHARILLIETIWKRFLGFITGMILALIGATFVLGKLQEPASDLNAEGFGWKFGMGTASPGLMLAVLGTALMLSTIVVKNEITVNDGTAYLQSVVTSKDSVGPAFPTPPPLPPSLPGQEGVMPKEPAKNNVK